MLRQEFFDAQWKAAREIPEANKALVKIKQGDIRGARVRLERLVEVLKEVEESSCNEAGWLNDPGDDQLNDNKPGKPR